MVCGIPRSGTSMTAGVVNRLGIPFFTDQVSSSLHAAGYYRDEAFEHAMLRQNDSSMINLISKRGRSCWGVKCHGMNARVYRSLAKKHELLIIHVTRNRKAVWESLDRKRERSGQEDKEIRSWSVRSRIMACERRLRDMRLTKGPRWLDIRFEDLLQKPKKWTRIIAGFIEYAPSPRQLDDILQFIDPEILESKS